MDVHGKVVVITGASAGIGKATAYAFAEAGAKLALIARSTETLQQLAEELGKTTDVLPITADVSKPEDVNRAIDETYAKFGRVDVLINNAGQGLYGPITTIQPDLYRQIIDLNVLGPLYGIQAASPKMAQNGGGLIINISSMVSKMVIPGIGAYASTKYALNCLTQTADAELSKDNIRVITVYPGLTATDFGKNSAGADKAGARPAVAAQMQGDSAEKVAGRILEAAQNEPIEQFMDGTVTVRK